MKIGQARVSARSRETISAEALFYPRSIAIVGATSRPGSWSGNVFQSLRTGGFMGEVVAVNPRYSEVWGLPCFPALAEVPSPPDQVLVLVPAHRVVEVIREAAHLGARSAVIYGSGFGEDASAEAQERGAELAAALADTGIAAIGPNCLGYASYPARAMTLTSGVTDVRVVDGSIGIVAQSGGVALALNRELVRRRLRPRFVVSSGNECGLALEDYLEFFLSDPAIRTIGLFIETVKDSERFIRLGREALKRGKPIVTVKMGGSVGARKAAVAHTGRLAGSQRVFADISETLGIVCVDTLDETLDVLSVLSTGRLPPSPRVGAVTVSGGLKAILLDSAERWGLEIPELSPETVKAIAGLLSVGTAVGNPLDAGFTGLSDVKSLHQLIQLVTKDPRVDNLIVQHRLPESPAVESHDRPGTLEAVERASDNIAGVAMVTEGFVSGLPSEYGFDRLASLNHVAFAGSAERGLAALARAARYRQKVLQVNRERQNRQVPRGTVTGGSGRLQALLTGEAGDELSSKELLRQRGFVVPGSMAIGPDGDSAEAVATFGWPLIIKATLPGVAHKSEFGLVSSLIWSQAQFDEQHAKLLRNAAAVNGTTGPPCVYVEEAVLGGLECAMGLTRDAEFGMVLMFGSGGLGIEIYDDVSFTGLWASPSELAAMVSRTRVGRLLEGERGRKYDIAGVLDALRRLCDLGREYEEVLDAVDINPIAVLPEGEGAIVLDAAFRLQPVIDRRADDTGG